MSTPEALPRLKARPELGSRRPRLAAVTDAIWLYAPVCVFWAGTLALNASTVAVLAVLSHHHVTGGLSGASAVLALSLVVAVIPGALQLRAASDAAERRHTPRPPWRVFAPVCLAMALAVPAVSWAASVPVTAGVLVAAQLPPAIALSVYRGELIGRRYFGAAGANLLIDSSVRLGAGIALGLAWGPTGIAAGLFLATLAALAAIWGRADFGDRALGRPLLASGAALASVGLLANVDLLVAPRVLGHAGADHFDVAALPAQGIFVALFAASWVAIPGARARAQTMRQALGPVASTLLLGAAGTVALLILRPVVAEALGKHEPAIALLVPLALAKAMTGAAAVSVNVSVARNVRGPWIAPLLASALLVAAAAFVHPEAQLLAFMVLAAQAAALVAATVRMLAPSRPAAAGASGLVRELRETPVPAAQPIPRPPAQRELPGAGRRRRRLLPARRPPRPRLEAPATEPKAPRLPYFSLTAVSAALMALCFAQAPGKLIADTKLDLVVDPGRFLERAVHLWDPSAAFGQVQNQAVGYLFPMGPFFALGKASGLPMWIVQRIWIGLVLIVALWGLAKLARALAIGRPHHWVIAGTAYAASPFFLGELASTSAALLPAAMVPWALLALVHGSRRGSTRRAAGLSGLAVACMGGVNAAATLAVLPLPALWLITRERSPRRRSLALWWVLAVTLAIAWWLLPLFFQQRWGFNFLPFTETAYTTQVATSAFEALRGTGYWLSYLSLNGPWLPAGWSLATSSLIIVGSAVLAAAGVAGLARARISERGFLVASAVTGAVLVCAGYLGPAGGLLHDPIRSALDGPFSSLRNVEKFEPVLRLPLALGLAAALASLPGRRLAQAGAGVATLALIAVAALPLIRGQLPQSGSFDRVPADWHRLADYIDRHGGGSNTLLVPAAPFGEYTWGRPLDEPLQALAHSKWASRNLVPLGGGGSTTMLDAIEQRIEDGTSSPGLQDALARAGVHFVVARNDLDWRRADSPRPAQVHAALVGAGLRRVASFGPPVPEPQASGSLLPELGIGRFESRLPQIEVFAVRRQASLVRALPANRTVAVSGGPASIPELTDQHLLGAGDPAVTVADLRRSVPEQRWAVTDALRRTDSDFGLVHDKDSYTLEPGQRAAGALGPQRQLLGAHATTGHEAVTQLNGSVRSVTASSYGSWLLQLPFVQPANAFDGNSSTAWVDGAHGSSVGQWVQANYRRPIDPSELEVRLLEDGPWRPLVRQLVVSTEAGSVASTVRPDESLQRIAVPAGTTSWVRITFSRLGHQLAGGATPGLRDVRVFARRPGSPVPAAIPPTRPWVRVPEESPQLAAAARNGSEPAFTFSRLSADPLDVLRRDQEPQLRRLFRSPTEARMKVSATAVPARGARLDSLLTPQGALEVRASSSWNSLPEYRPANLVDGSRRTSWVAAATRPQPANAPGVAGLQGFGVGAARRSLISPGPIETDPHPSIQLSWSGERTLSSLRVDAAGSFAARPQRIRISSPDGTRNVSVPAGGEIHFAPLRTDSVSVSFPRVSRRFTTTGLDVDPRERLPVGISELDFPALRDLQLTSPLPGTVIREPCGQGPPIYLDGRRLATSVTVSASDLVQLRSLPVRVCTPAQSLRLAAGDHKLRSRPGSAFTLSTLSLTPRDWSAGTSQRRPTEIVHWGDEHRTIRVGPGAGSYLAVRENFNRGWMASLDGRRLAPVRLDGWQQGFLLPAGRGGLVKLEFTPESSYSIVLRIGAALAIGLLMLILCPPWRRREGADPARAGRRPRVAVLCALTAAAVALISLPAALMVPVACLIARRWPAAVPWAAGAAVLAATAVVVARPDPHPLEQAAAFGAPAQILTVAGIAFLAASLIPARERRTDAR